MRTWHRFRHLSAAALATVVLAAGCNGSVITQGAGTAGTGASTSTSSAGNGGGACGAVTAKITQGGVDKIDLVLMVDNSRYMADKQQILSLALPDLLNPLLNPACVDASGVAVPASMQPSPTGICPSGTTRVFPPIYDVHVGLLSSSLGSFGADGCPDSVPNGCPDGATNTSNDDHGHLVTRTDPCAPANVPTWNDEGFLAWDPMQVLTPPGESQLGGSGSPGMITDLANLVLGDGQDGCGFESQNESWYRFLADPSPYASITLNGQTVQTSGTDSVLLQQRQEFLRPDSLLAVVTVTDETDTSIVESSFYPLFAQELENNLPFHLPHPRIECSTKGPTDPCCGSCGQPPPTGCPVDPNCTTSPTYTDADENLALRAFGLSTGLMSHKARYGIEFFYQPSRYVGALTSSTVTDSMGNTTPNPIFAGGRDPSLVFYATITGVPWQLIARQDGGVNTGTPDLVNGVSALDPTQVGGFKSFAELSLTDAHGNTFWDDIVGNPEQYVPALSPFMQESTVPRSGTDPITGISISPPAPHAAGMQNNPINGNEYNIPTPPGVIEYACVFPILNPIDCSQPEAVCDCGELAAGEAPPDNPLCEPNPNDNGNLTLQTRAKAYPGLKNLAIAKGMGNQGVVASICAKQLTDDTQPDYGYRPAVTAIADTLGARLKTALDGQCLAQSLTPDASGQVQCAVVEARNTGGAACDCTGTARSPVPAADECVVQTAMSDPMAATAGWNCFCEIDQTQGAAEASCQDDVAPSATASGYCYVDGSTTPAIGNPAIVASCPTGDKRILRFVGAGSPAQGSTVFISCQ